MVSLRIHMCEETNINLGDFKAILLASLRSLVPKDWEGVREVAWSWLWDNTSACSKHSSGRLGQG